MYRDSLSCTAVLYWGTSNRCIYTDIIHEAEKWNHDEWLDCSFMQTHTLIHKKTSTQAHNSRHIYTQTPCTHRLLWKPAQWVRVRMPLSNQQSPQAQDPFRKKQEISHFYLVLMCCIYPDSYSFGCFYLIPCNRLHGNVMKCGRGNKMRESTGRFIITLTLFYSTTPTLV